jgi:MYXO-CTERM domain-containing protein
MPSLLVVAATVVASHSAWNTTHDAIHTDLLVRDDDGHLRVERVPGGVVGDMGMVQFELRVRGAPDGRAGAPATWQPVEYVRSTSSSSGAPLRWDKSCVYLTPDAAGVSDISGDDELAVMEQAAQNWRAATQSCSYLDFVFDAPEPNETFYDGKNVIKFREDTWCRPAHGGDPKQCYSPQAAALTTVFYVNAPGKANDGVIRDADVEINAVDFAIGVCQAPGVCTTAGAGTVSDLENTLTHELGHLIGLDHTCWDMPGAAPLDDQGQPAPLCSAMPLPAKITDATMYNFQDPGEIKKRTPEADDVAGFCAIYPIASDPGVCERAGTGGGGGCACAAGGSRHGAPTWAALTLLGLALAATRRR